MDTRALRFFLTGLMLVASAFVRAETLTFGVIGDTPYSPSEEIQFESLLKRLQNEPLAFLVHVGDFKSGSSLCDDATFAARKRMFDASAHPFIYVPGDNDWTDCHRPAAGEFYPPERLDALRRLFFSTPESLGRRRLPLSRQKAFPENQRWTRSGVVFMSLHVVGSNIGLSPPVDTMYAARERANQDWLAEGFRLAHTTNAHGIVIFMQADPRFDLTPGVAERSGFDNVLAALEQKTAAWGKPVLLVHGDGHRFRIDRPLAERLPHFTRVETYGSPIVNWVEIDVDPGATGLFLIEPGLLPGSNEP